MSVQYWPIKFFFISFLAGVEYQLATGFGLQAFTQYAQETPGLWKALTFIETRRAGRIPVFYRAVHSDPCEGFQVPYDQ
jgi:hypothetical protein